MRKAGVFLLLLSGLALQGAKAEYDFFTPRGSFAVEISLDNSPYLRLPIYRNAIVSLEVVGEHAVGGTAAERGLAPFLFSVSLPKRRLEAVFDLAGLVPGQRSVQSGFGKGMDGMLYAGTMPDRGGDSGHLIEIRLENGIIRAVDLGIPVPGEGIFALAADPARKTIYGIAHPSGHFFVHELAGGKTRKFEQTAFSRQARRYIHEYALEPEDMLSRRLILDRGSRVYGSVPGGKLFRYDPGPDQILILPDGLPEVWGRKPLGRVDAWALAPDGTLYGGNAGDGQLFRLDPATGKVANLGKPAMMPRLKGLAFAADNNLYGVTGSSPGYAHLFCYDHQAGSFTDLGNPRFTMTEPGIEQGIAWRGFQIGALAASSDGKYIVMGEEEALSQLMVFTLPYTPDPVRRRP